MVKFTGLSWAALPSQYNQTFSATEANSPSAHECNKATSAPLPRAPYPQPPPLHGPPAFVHTLPLAV
eukprot:6467976-Amphidinium_carterae.1